MTLAVYRATLRLILRSFWIYAVTVPMLGLAWVAGMKCRGTTCLTEFFHQPFMMFFFLGQMLAAVASIQTERTQRAEEMLAALPGSTAATVAGRAGAIFTAWLAAGTLIFLTLILRGGLGDPLFTLLDWFLVLPLTLVFTTGVAYGVATWLRRGFTAYVVSLLIFLAATFPFNQLTSSIYRALTGAGPFSTLDFTLSSYFQLGGLPIFPDFWPLVFNRVHAIGVGLFWLALVIWMVGRRRREGVRKAAVVAIASLALVLISFTASRGVWAQRVYRSETERSGATASSGEAVPGLPAPVVDAFDLILSLDTAHSAMKATAELDVSQTGETAPFSLNRSFTVTAVTGPDGKAVPFARSGDLLLLTTEGRPGRYTVKYAGLVWQWRDDMWNGLRLAAHVAAGSVVLPQGMGWYPVPGHQTLTFVQRNRVYDTRIWHRPAPVRLTVQGANDLTFVSNALDGAPVTGAWVVGTRWTEITGKHTRICVSPEHELQARQFDWEMGHEIAWLETLVPLGRKPAIVEVPSSLWSVQSALETRGFPGGIIVDPSFLMRMDGMRLHGHLLQMWWNTPRTEEEGEVYDVLRQFMANLYAQEVEGRSQAYVSLLRLSGDLGTQTEPGKQLLAALRDFRQGRGLAETGALLRTLYDTPAPLTYAQVARAIKGEQP